MILERHGVEVSCLGGYLRLQTFDRNAGPVHLTMTDLATLGLVMDAPAGVMPSKVQSATRSEPHPTSWFGVLQFEIGDYVFIPVTDGLDLFVSDHDPIPGVFRVDELRLVGLRVL